MRLKFGKYKNRTVASCPAWWLRWAFKFANQLTEDERYIIAMYINEKYEPKTPPIGDTKF